MNTVSIPLRSLDVNGESITFNESILTVRSGGNLKSWELWVSGYTFAFNSQMDLIMIGENGKEYKGSATFDSFNSVLGSGDLIGFDE